MDLLVSQNVLDFIERIDPKGKRNALASIELLQALFHVVCVPDLDIVREGRICQNVDEAFVGHLPISLLRINSIDGRKVRPPWAGCGVLF